jgi:Ca-activated chloride channel family protein
LAETQSRAADPVAGLIDIPLPREVSLWPQTWEARLATVLLLVVVIASVWRFAHHRRVNRYRREALAELNAFRRSSAADRSDLLARLSVLVRRTALAAFPRDQVAPLTGPAWLAFLDRSYGGQEFSKGVGRLLVNGPYWQIAPDDAELQSLVTLVRRWIRRHYA